MKESHIRSCSTQKVYPGSRFLRAVKYGICALAAAAVCLLTGCAKEKEPQWKR